MRHTARWSAHWISALLAASLAASAAGGRPPPATPSSPQAVPPDAARQAGMQVHFAQVMAVHDAVIRGDVTAARERAASLTSMEAALGSLPEGSAPYVSAMRDAARRTAAASSVLQAALGTAAMLKICGDCHRSLGAKPAAPADPAGSEVRGLAGHMLAHQQAADQMLQGLVLPSSDLWRAGAAGLSAPPLTSGHLPHGGRLGPEEKASEGRIHVLAGQAERVDDAGARAVYYAQILARCADCHAAHRTVSGPSRR